MSFSINNDTHPGRIYINERGEAYELISWCMEPTVTLKNVADGHIIDSGINGLNLKPFMAIDGIDIREPRANEKALRKALQQLAEQCKTLLDTNTKLKKALIATKRQLTDEILKRGQKC